MNPPDAQDLADYLGVTLDPLCEQSAAAAVKYTENRRTATDPVLLWIDPDVNLGTLQHAALLYQTKAAPTGLPDYDDIQSTYGASMAGIHRLLGGPDPVVA